jgi:hypothetical protein
MGAMVYPNPGGTGAAFATCELTQINPTAALELIIREKSTERR